MNTDPDLAAESVVARCRECGERFKIPTPERLGDRVYVTCPRCQMPLTAKWYGPAPSDGLPAADDLTLAEADDAVALAEVPVVDGLPVAVDQVRVALGEEVVKPSEEASHPTSMPAAGNAQIDGRDA